MSMVSLLAVIGTTTSILRKKIRTLLRFKAQTIFVVLIIGSFLLNQYLRWRITNRVSGAPTSGGIIGNGLSEDKFTPFDIALTKERMDKNIGILGSQHIHADFKVYVNGHALTFAKPDYYMKSSFMHVDASQNTDDANSVLHMHATKVPLGIFFRSIGIQLAQNSLMLDNGHALTNTNGNSLKFYLNGHKVDELNDYVFQPLDKLLISYGPDNDPDIVRQINSITDFAKNH